MPVTAQTFNSPLWSYDPSAALLVRQNACVANTRVVLLRCVHLLQYVWSRPFNVGSHCRQPQRQRREAAAALRPPCRPIIRRRGRWAGGPLVVAVSLHGWPPVRSSAAVQPL